MVLPVESSCRPTSKASLSVSDRDVVKQLRYWRGCDYLQHEHHFDQIHLFSKINLIKTTWVNVSLSWDAVLPCLSGCVSAGWHDHTVRCDGLRLGTTGVEKEKKYAAINVEVNIVIMLISVYSMPHMMHKQSSPSCTNRRWYSRFKEGLKAQCVMFSSI